MKTVAIMDTSSPRITEYGRVRETKKDWKTLSEVGFEMPSPAESDIANALAVHLVIVSGTLAITTVFPVTSLSTNQKYLVDMKSLY